MECLFKREVRESKSNSRGGRCVFVLDFAANRRKAVASRSCEEIKDMHKLGMMCEEDLIYSAMLLICTHTIFMPCDCCQGARLAY